ARALRLLDVARDYAARGERRTAVALTREVLRHTPDFPPARRLLAELEPGAATAK
ncbi:MAG: tetratricopeptide repeat protein, partial [Opitutaceae bacterium]|nr:tetratricopeptide repeat protein [Opitutaceae bacterium]